MLEPDAPHKDAFAISVPGPLQILDIAGERFRGAVAEQLEVPVTVSIDRKHRLVGLRHLSDELVDARPVLHGLVLPAIALPHQPEVVAHPKGLSRLPQHVSPHGEQLLVE